GYQQRVSQLCGLIPKSFYRLEQYIVLIYCVFSEIVSTTISIEYSDNFLPRIFRHKNFSINSKAIFHKKQGLSV
ncbi:hypothetical protein, partial [Peribacillus simplex]|uniref:hypothetical protein n=1 Tax=Peribacillus simplex TaxID=1478 RepID=UPI001E38B551